MNEPQRPPQPTGAAGYPAPVPARPVRRKQPRVVRQLNPTGRPGRRTLLLTGRLSVCIEPRDLWFGIYLGRSAVYVCLLPMVAFRWARKQRSCPPPFGPPGF